MSPSPYTKSQTSKAVAWRDITDMLAVLCLLELEGNPVVVVMKNVEDQGMNQGVWTEVDPNTRTEKCHVV